MPAGVKSQTLSYDDPADLLRPMSDAVSAVAIKCKLDDGKARFGLSFSLFSQRHGGQ